MVISDLVSLIFFCVVAGWILGCFLIGLAWVFVMLFWIGLDRDFSGVCVWKFWGSWCVGVFFDFSLLFFVFFCSIFFVMDGGFGSFDF